MQYNKLMQRFLLRKLGRPGYNVVLIAALIIIFLVIGTLFYHYAEGLSLVNAVYFTAMTLTTVGYGDFAPQTDAGKLFTSVFALFGVGIFLGLAGAIFQVTLGRLKRGAWPWSKK